MMSSESSPSIIYIPFCGDKDCHSYSLLQFIVKKIRERDVKCQTEHPANGKYTNWFKHFSEQCRFTIIHYCPFVWKRIKGLDDYIQSRDEKFILLRIVPKAQGNIVYESIKPCIIESLDGFFDEMDCELKVSDEKDAEIFVKKVMFETAPRPRHECMKSFEDGVSESVATFSMSSYDETQTHSMYQDEVIEEDDTNISESLSEVAHNFERYCDVFGSADDMSVFVRSCDAQWICPEGFEHVSTSKLVEQINGLKANDLQEMNKYILNKLLPVLCQEKKLVELSNIITCKWNILRERALVLFEYLLWEQGPGINFQIKDVQILVKGHANLSLVIQKLRTEYEDQKTQANLILQEHIAHVSLMLLSNIILLSATNREASIKAETYLRGKESELSNLSGSLDSSKKTLKIFLEDAIRCSSVHDNASKYLQLKDGSNDLDIDCSPKALLKESLCVQAVVVFGLLKKVFSLNKDVLSFLKDYLKQTDKKWGKKISPPIVCVTLVFRGLNMFLSHSIRKKGTVELNDICKKAMDVIVVAVERNTTDEINRSVLPLLFNSKDLIRKAAAEEIFKEKGIYRQENIVNFGANAVGQLLLPFITDVPDMFPQVAEKSQTQDKTSTQPPEWNEFEIRYAEMPAKMFVHTISKGDHKEQNKSDLKKDDCHYIEMLILRKLKHENILEMYAFQEEMMPQFYILEDGRQRLQIQLKNARQNKTFLERHLLCKLLLDALKGLRYCHDQGYIHRNLTALSISVFNMQSAKLCDFGMCTRQASSEIAVEYNSKTLPLRWSAKESILEGEFSKQSDIWMTGHLIFEVLTHGLLPYSGITDDDFVEALQRGHHYLLRQECLSDQIFDLIMKCTDNLSQSRPSIEEVLTILEEETHRDISEASQEKVTFPAIDGKTGVSSLGFSRGIPKKYCLRNVIKSKSHIKGIQVIHMTDSMKQITTSGEIVIEEKLVHSMSLEALASIHAKDFQDILPPFKLFKNADDKEHIKCSIPRSTSLYNLILERKLGDHISVYMRLIYTVAETIQQLHSRSWIIGDLSPSSVYVDKKLKTYIVSFSLLKFIGPQDTSPSETKSKREAEKIQPHRKSSAAPEVINSGLFSPASDVFCLGNFIWVLLTAFDKCAEKKNAVNDAEIHPFDDLPTQEKKFKALMTGKWEESNKQPSCCPDALYRLLLQCVSVKERDRPPVTQICEHMKGLFNEEEIKYAVTPDLQVKEPSTLREKNPSVSSHSSASDKKSLKKTTKFYKK